MSNEQISQRLLQIALCMGIAGYIYGFNAPASAAPTCPPRARTIPVVSWLVNNADSIMVHRFTSKNGNLSELKDYPKSITDPKLINRVLNLTGSYVKWNGYESPSPFGSFHYPRWGEWYGKVELQTKQGIYEIWMWRSYRYNLGQLLVFTFSDLAQSADNSGAHLGHHDFCVSSVQLSIIRRLD